MVGYILLWNSMTTVYGKKKFTQCDRLTMEKYIGNTVQSACLMLVKGVSTGEGPAGL